MTKPKLTGSLKDFELLWRWDFALFSLLSCVPLRNAEAWNSWSLRARLKGSAQRTTASKRYKQIKNETKIREIIEKKTENKHTTHKWQHTEQLRNTYRNIMLPLRIAYLFEPCNNYNSYKKRIKLTEDWFCEWFWDECPCEGERSCRFTNWWWGRRRWLGDGPGDDPLLEPPGGPGFKPIFNELSGWVWSIRPFPP